MVILPAKFSEKTKNLILVNVLNGLLEHKLASLLYLKQEHKQRANNQSREMHKQHAAIHDMICEM